MQPFSWLCRLLRPRPLSPRQADRLQVERYQAHLDAVKRLRHLQNNLDVLAAEARLLEQTRRRRAKKP